MGSKAALLGEPPTAYGRRGRQAGQCQRRAARCRAGQSCRRSLMPLAAEEPKALPILG